MHKASSGGETSITADLVYNARILKAKSRQRPLQTSLRLPSGPVGTGCSRRNKTLSGAGNAARRAFENGVAGRFACYLPTATLSRGCYHLRGQLTVILQPEAGVPIGEARHGSRSFAQSGMLRDAALNGLAGLSPMIF